MKYGKECEIKLDIPVLLQLQLQLNSPKEIRRDSKALLPGTGTEITNSPHPLLKSTFLPSRVGRCNIKWCGPGWKTFCLNLSHQHRIKYLIKTYQGKISSLESTLSF